MPSARPGFGRGRFPARPNHRPLGGIWTPDSSDRRPHREIRALRSMTREVTVDSVATANGNVGRRGAHSARSLRRCDGVRDAGRCPDRSLLPPRLVDPLQRCRRRRRDPGGARFRLATASPPSRFCGVRRLADPVVANAALMARRHRSGYARCRSGRPTLATKPHSPSRRRMRTHAPRWTSWSTTTPLAAPSTGCDAGPARSGSPPRGGAAGRRVARSFGIPVGTAKWRLHAARNALRRRWRPRHDRSTRDRRPDLPRAACPPAGGGRCRTAGAYPRRGRDHHPAAGAALVPRRSQRSGPGCPPTEPAHRGRAPGRAGIRERAAVGALRMLQRDPVDELSLEPPADLPASSSRATSGCSSCRQSPSPGTTATRPKAASMSIARARSASTSSPPPMPRSPPPSRSSAATA